MIAQKELKEILHYNPKTGVFVWLNPAGCRIKPGSIAGSNTGKGYTGIRINKRLYYAHRLAWLYVYGVWPENHIDHINHKKADNRIKNLRDVTRQNNQRNLPVRHNTSGVTGVRWQEDIGRWTSRIFVDNKEKHLHCSKDKFEAICARKSANNKYGFHENHGMGDLKSILKR